MYLKHIDTWKNCRNIYPNADGQIQIECKNVFSAQQKRGLNKTLETFK